MEILKTAFLVVLGVFLAVIVITVLVSVIRSVTYLFLKCVWDIRTKIELKELRKDKLNAEKYIFSVLEERAERLGKVLHSDSNEDISEKKDKEQ